MPDIMRDCKRLLPLVLAMMLALLFGQCSYGSAARQASALIAPLDNYVMADLPAQTGFFNEDWMRGLSIPYWWGTQYTGPETDAALTKMQAMHVKWIAVVPTWCMDSKYSTTIYAKSGSTISGDDLKALIDKIKAAGFKVMLKPHVDSLDGNWRGDLTPSDRAAWHNSYRQMILANAAVARDCNVDLFCVGCEFVTMSPDTDEWGATVAAIRGIAGDLPLTYAAKRGGMAMASICRANINGLKRWVRYRIGTGARKSSLPRSATPARPMPATNGEPELERLNG